MTPMDDDRITYAPTELGATGLESVGGETRLGMRKRFDQLEPKHKIWLLVGVGVLLALGGLGWWIARQRAKGKCKPVLEWTLYNARVIVEQCPVADGFVFLGTIPEQKVEGVTIDEVTSPALASTDAVRHWAKTALQERLG